MFRRAARFGSRAQRVALRTCGVIALGTSALSVLALVASAFGIERPRHEGPDPTKVLSAPALRDTEDAAPDTGLGGFLGGLSDSTDRYFGLAAARPDTAGDDSALAYGLGHLSDERPGAFTLSYGPSFAFNRVDGPVWGGFVGIGRPNRLGQLTGQLAYAAGPNDWLEGGEYRKTFREREARWSLRLFAGRITTPMDGDHPEMYLATLRALVSGKDRSHYYRRDGFESRIERETNTWRLGVGYRDMLETQARTTTTWNLEHKRPAVIGNLAAAPGRAREFEIGAACRLPFVPVITEITHRASGGGIGSDFEYRRTLVAIGGNFGLGDLAAVVPQLAYGRLSLMPLPQESFYLGGEHSLRSLPNAARGGTGLALARLDVIGAFDILAAAHIPHPDAFPIQVGLFAAVGSVWGKDPYGIASVPGVDWPRRESWLGEAGVSLIYQPGIPDPLGMFRLNFAQPLGPGGDRTRWSLSYSRALDLVRPFSP